MVSFKELCKGEWWRRGLFQRPWERILDCLSSWSASVTLNLSCCKSGFINLNLQMKETGVLGVLGRAWMSVDIPKSTETGHVSPILNSNMTIVHLCVLVTTPRWWTAMLDVVLVSTVRSLHREMQLSYFNCTMYRIRKKHSLKCSLFTPTCYIFRREAYEWNKNMR